GLPAALADARPAVRGAAAHVLGRRGDDHAAVRGLLTDRDVMVRFRTAVALTAARDRAGVPVLIDLLTQESDRLGWQVEDALFRLAGDAALTVAPGPEQRTRLRDAWAAWWKANADTVDLARIDDGERMTGLTLGI